MVPNNYVGSIYGSLGGTPKFGRGSNFGNDPVATQTRTRGFVMR